MNASSGRLFINDFSFSLSLRSGGFRPRHLKRLLFSGNYAAAICSQVMNSKFVLIIFGIVLSASFAVGQKRQSKQSIRGIITTVISQDALDYFCSDSNRTKPIAREVAVYEPLKFSDLKHCDYTDPDCHPDVWDSVNGKLVATTKSDKKGLFRVSLPEGKYSLIVKQEKGYYVPGNYPNPTNATDVLSFEVIEGKTSRINLEINCSTGEKRFRLYQAIKAKIGEARAAKVSQCRFIGVGAKPCGGPWNYLVYSTMQTDETGFIKLVNEFYIIDRKYNEELRLISDCADTTPPSETYLEDGICKIR